MTTETAAGRAGDPTDDNSVTPTPPERCLLPRGIQEKFENPDRWSTGRTSTSIGQCWAAEMNVAAWMYVLGWNETGLVAALEERDTGLASSKGRLDPWSRRHQDARDHLAVGAYMVDGAAPARGQGLYRAWNVWRNDQIQKTGCPRLGRDDLLQYLDDVLAVFDAAPRSRTWRTDRHVLEASLKIASHAGTVAPALPARRLGERTSANKETVSTALRRLRATGFLQPFGRRSPATAQCYVVRAPRSHHPYSSLVVPGPSTASRLDTKCPDSGTLPRQHPAFHEAALGRTGFDLLEALASKPATDQKWWQLAEVSHSAFYRRKPALVGKVEGLPALAVRSEGGWRMVDGDVAKLLDVHARHHGTDTSCQKTQDANERARRGFRGFLLRNVSDRYEPLDLLHALDHTTGEIVEIDSIVGHGGKPVAVEALAGASPAEPESHTMPSPTRDSPPNPQEFQCPAA